ncbi:NAD(P)-dependent oxidoreductase [Patescibacteria group bacterium]
MKTICFYKNQWEKDYLSENLEGGEMIFLEGSISDHPDFSDSEVEVLTVFVKSHIGAEELDRFPNLKFIATRSTGFDHINLEEADKRGIVVSNVPTYGENTVAEFAFALLLNLSRKICSSYKRVLEQGSFSQESLSGFDLRGKTIGIIGAGNIGRHSIRIAKGFGMEVLAFDIKKDEEFAKEVGFKYADFDEILQTADIISLHVPYNPHTHHLINKENISSIKQGVYLINTSRGAVVETSALVEALEKGILAGAGLDVLEEEGYMGNDTELLADDHPDPETLKVLLSNQYLIDHPNVIITPHNAFQTKEAIERIFKTTVENIKAFEEGEPKNVVEVKK